MIIRHINAREEREVTRHEWNSYPNKSLWKIIDEGDPVIWFSINNQKKHKRERILDRDHAERIIEKNPKDYYYIELVEENEIKQKILEHISQLHNPTVGTLSNELQYDINTCYYHCQLIEEDGYIQLIDATSKDGIDALINLLPMGKVFLSNGGYTSSKDRIQQTTVGSSSVFINVTKQEKEQPRSKKAFIIHGHNESIKYEVARLIENECSTKPIILHEQPNKGKTVIEKFETYSEVDFAIALWTADDLGKAKWDNELKPRARQNVIFETGYFIGKLGRERVIILYEEGVEIASDYSGVVYISLSGNWKHDLRKEIDSMEE